MKRGGGIGWVLGLAALVGVTVAVAGSAEAAPSNDPASGGDSEAIAFPSFAGTEGAAMLEQLARAAGLHDTWVRWMLATARGESHFTSNVVLGARALYPVGSVPSPLTDSHGPAEAAAAVVAYDRAREQGRLTCRWPKVAYSFGAGGWLGQIPANAWAAYHNTRLACRHPWYLLHPVDQIITAIEQLRRLSGWSAWKAEPTVLTARVGWSRPASMGDPEYRARVASTFADDLEFTGLTASTPLPSLPPKGDVFARWEALMNQFAFAPGRLD